MTLTPTTCPCCQQPIYSFTLLPIEAQKKVLACAGLNVAAMPELLAVLRWYLLHYGNAGAAEQVITHAERRE